MLCPRPAGEDERGGSRQGRRGDQQSAQHASADVMVRVPLGQQPVGKAPAEDKPRSTLVMPIHAATPTGGFVWHC